MTPLATPIPAATVVIVRDRPGATPEFLMVERSPTMAFAGGALVFPGGRVDPGDRQLAATFAPDVDMVDEIAARIAAIRETLEEVGLAIGLHPPPSIETLADVRRGLHIGQPFATLLNAAGLSIVPDALVPFARWLPAHHVSRIFDTRFYLARLPGDAPPASVDRTENVRLLWTTADAVLGEAAAGRATLIFPTRRNLERLAGFASFAEAVADAMAHPIRTISPTIERRGGVDHLCIPDGIGYPVTTEPLGAVDRG